MMFPTFPQRAQTFLASLEPDDELARLATEHEAQRQRLAELMARDDERRARIATIDGLFPTADATARGPLLRERAELTGEGDALVGFLADQGRRYALAHLAWLRRAHDLAFAEQVRLAEESNAADKAAARAWRVMQDIRNGNARTPHAERPAQVATLREQARPAEERAAALNAAYNEAKLAASVIRAFGRNIYGCDCASPATFKAAAEGYGALFADPVRRAA